MEPKQIKELARQWADRHALRLMGQPASQTAREAYEAGAALVSVRTGGISAHGFSRDGLLDLKGALDTYGATYLTLSVGSDEGGRSIRGCIQTWDEVCSEDDKKYVVHVTCHPEIG